MVYTRPVWVRTSQLVDRLIKSGSKNNGANSKQDNVMISEFLSFYFLFFNFVLLFILVFALLHRNISMQQDDIREILLN